MSTDWKALAAELAAELERCRPLAEVPDCLARARAVLAAEADGPAVQSREPASVVGEPSDEELIGIAAQAIEPYDKISLGEYEAENNCAIEVYTSELIAFARAVLARYGHQPAPPAEGEVGELVEFLRIYGDEVMDEYGDVGEHDQLTRAADLLERQAAPVPVPVSERLPSNADCDSEYRCWIGSWSDIDGELAFDWSYDSPKRYTWEGIAAISCWLPATALPLPQGEVQP